MVDGNKRSEPWRRVISYERDHDMRNDSLSMNCGERAF
jgi:hypothetical protein